MAVTQAVMRLYATFRHLVHEMAKFGVIGAGTYVIDAALANYLHFGAPNLGPVTSKAISTTIAATVSYFANRHWTWRHRARSGLRREYVIFFVLSAIGLAITEACVGFTEYVLGYHSVLAYNLSANVFGVVLGTVFRFWSFRRWVFLAPGEASQPEKVSAAVQ